MNDSSSKKPLEQQLVNVLMKDRRSERRWKNIRFFIWIFLLLLYAILIFSPSKKTLTGKTPKHPYVALLRLNGVIMARSNFSAKKVVPQLIKAFRDKNAKGVVLVINSPGGSPVQASIIHDKIIQLKRQYKKKVVVEGQDVLASGAYLVATAADKIYVHKDTLTGSIGVIMSGFGFSDAIHKLGITRRVFTAGKNKDRLDPFEPLDPEDKEKVENVLNAVHQNFISDVVAGRGNRLKGNREELFSGDFWTGQQATKLGLVDGTANLWTVLRSQFGVTHYKNYSVRQTFLEALVKGVESQLKIGLTMQSAPVQEVFQ